MLQDIDSYLWKNYRKFSSPEYMFGLDNNQNPPERFDKAKLRVLVGFLSPGVVRSVSSTYASLEALIRHYVGEDVFIDYAYFPPKEDLPIFIREGLPIWFGNVSHRPVRDYDVLAVSQAISVECLNMPWALKYSGIPLSFAERYADSTVPIILYGGAASHASTILFGRPGQSLVDGAYIGLGDGVVDVVFKELLELNVQQPLKQDKERVFNFLLKESACREYFYFPAAYDFIPNSDKCTIKEVKKVIPEAPDKVKVGTARSDFVGFPKKIFNLDGAGATGHDIMISQGCSSYSCSFCVSGETRVFTSRGMVRIDSLAPSQGEDIEANILGLSGRCLATKFYSLGKKEVIRLVTSRGYSLEVTPDHRVATMDGDEIFWRRAGSLRPGDYVVLRRGPGVFGRDHLYRFAAHAMGDRFGQHCLDPGFDGKLPEEVLSYDRDSLCGFFEGWFSLSGSVLEDGRLTLSSKHKSLLEEVQCLLLNLGVVTSLVPLGQSLSDLMAPFYRLDIADSESRSRFLKGFSDLSFSLSQNVVLPDLKVPLSWNKRRKLIEILGKRFGQALSEDKKESIEGVSEALVKSVPRGLDPLFDDIGMGDCFFDFVVAVEPVGEKQVYDITTEPDHTFVANGFVVHNCSEGQLYGPWREKPLDKLITEMDEIKAWAAPNTLGFFSLNSNFYYRYLDLLKETARRFNNLSLIAMRADVVAESPEYLEIAKALGLVRISLAIEGMGERVRNHVLNKNLPRELIFRAATNCFKQKLIVLKFGMILTGFETEADVDEFISEMREVIRLRDEVGAATKIQLTFTPLVVYDNTPLRWFPRVTARNSLYNVRTMGRLIEAMQSLGIRTKFNGRGPGTFIEQTLLDLGHLGTDFLLDVTLNRGMTYYRHFTDEDRDRTLASLSSLGINPEDYLRARELDEPMNSEFMAFTTPQKFSEWKEMYRSGDFYHPYCLKTAANEKAKCYGCGLCEPREVSGVVSRSLENESTVDDVRLALSENRHVSSYRIAVKVDSKYSFYDRTALSHYITSLFLRNDERLFSLFYGVGKNTLTWVSDKGQKGWFGGDFVFETWWSGRFDPRVLVDLIPVVNSQLVVAKVESVYEVPRESKLDVRGWISYLGILSGVSMTQIRDRAMVFDWKVSVASKGQGTGLTTESVEMPELRDNLLMVQKGDKVLIHLSVPVGVNPYLVMSSLLLRPYAVLLQQAQFNVLDHYKESQGVCRCGKPLGYSLIRDKQFSHCPSCMGRSLLYSMTR